jgi:hypothetical protein
MGFYPSGVGPNYNSHSLSFIAPLRFLSGTRTIFLRLEVCIGGGGGLYEFCPELIISEESGWSAG